MYNEPSELYLTPILAQAILQTDSHIPSKAVKGWTLRLCAEAGQGVIAGLPYKSIGVVSCPEQEVQQFRGRNLSSLGAYSFYYSLKSL